MPRRAELLVPDALKRRRLRAGARRGYRKIASEVEQQGVERNVVLVFLEIAQALAGRYVVFAVRAYVELNSRIERAVVGDVRGFDRFVIEILRESLDAGLKVRLAVCESVVLPAVEARFCGEIERDDRRAGYLYSLAAYMLFAVRVGFHGAGEEHTALAVDFRIALLIRLTVRVVLARRFAAHDEQTALRLDFVMKLAFEARRDIKLAVFADEADCDNFIGMRRKQLAAHDALALPVADRGDRRVKIERADVIRLAVGAVECQNEVAQGQVCLAPCAHEVGFYNILRLAQLSVERECAGFLKSFERTGAYSVLRVSRPKLVVV